MCALLGGRLAETVALRSLSTGAQDDLQRVTKLAYQMVASFGMDREVCLIRFVFALAHGVALDWQRALETSRAGRRSTGV